MSEKIYPVIVAMIKDRDARTDRYGEDAVFLVHHDLNDPEFVARHMDAKFHAAARAFQSMPESEQFKLIREVLNEPEPAVAEAAEELQGILATEHTDPTKWASLDSSADDLRALIARLETVLPYVIATLARNNGFIPEKLHGGFHGDPWDWLAVHGGRASSSVTQLENLLETIRPMKAKLNT
jgi:hypothetical protein